MTPERINAATKGGEKRTEKLTSKLPVYLGDWTARLAADGTVQFRTDVLGSTRVRPRTAAHRCWRLR